MSAAQPVQSGGNNLGLSTNAGTMGSKSMSQLPCTSHTLRRSKLLGPFLGPRPAGQSCELIPGSLLDFLRWRRVACSLVTVASMSMARGANAFPTSCCCRDMVGAS